MLSCEIAIRAWPLRSGLPTRKALLSVLSRYGLAVLVVFVALFVTWIAFPFQHLEIPFLLFVLAVLISAWRGGVGPGMLATVLVGANAPLTPSGNGLPFAQLPVEEGFPGPAQVQFVIVGGIISLLTGLGKQNRDLSRQKVEQLRMIVHNISEGVLATDHQGRVTFLNPAAEALTGWSSAEARGQPLEVVWKRIQEESHRPVEDLVGQVSCTGQSSQIALPSLLISRDGSACPIENRAVPITGADGRVLGIVLVFSDLRQRRQLEAERNRLVEQIEAERARLRALLEHMPAGVLLAEAPSGKILLANPRSQQLADCAPNWLRRETATDGSGDRVARGPLSRALTGETVRGEEYRFAQTDGNTTWLRVNAAPIHDQRGRLTGAIAVFDDISRERQAEEKLRSQLLWRLATIQEDERRRVARELHDEAGQQLTALILGLKAASRNPDNGVDPFQDLREQAEQLGRSLHRLACELRPSALDDLGLETVLRQCLPGWSRKAGLSVDLHCSLGPERLPPEMETHVYRIVNEAVTNTLKYAQARRLSIILQRHRDHLLVIVEDDGQGFDSAAVHRSASAERKLGLFGMQERAALMGGSLHLESTPGQGTSVIVRVPLATPGGSNR